MKSKVILLSLLLCMAFSYELAAQAFQPEEGKGMVVFYRKKKFAGSAIAFNVQDSQRTYGNLRNGDVIKVSVEPGEHTYYSKVFREDAITLNVAEGEVVYVKASIRAGYYAGRPKFELMDEKRALKDMK